MRARRPIAMSCTPHFSEQTLLRNAKTRVVLYDMAICSIASCHKQEEEEVPRCQVWTTFTRSLLIIIQYPERL